MCLDTAVIPKQPSCKKSVRPQKGDCEKRCEIQSGCQEITENYLHAEFSSLQYLIEVTVPFSTFS